MVPEVGHVNTMDDLGSALAGLLNSAARLRSQFSSRLNTSTLVASRSVDSEAGSVMTNFEVENSASTHSPELEDRDEVQRRYHGGLAKYQGYDIAAGFEAGHCGENH